MLFPNANRRSSRRTEVLLRQLPSAALGMTPIPKRKRRPTPKSHRPQARLTASRLQQLVMMLRASAGNVRQRAHAHGIAVGHAVSPRSRRQTSRTTRSSPCARSQTRSADLPRCARSNSPRARSHPARSPPAPARRRGQRAVRDSSSPARCRKCAPRPFDLLPLARRQMVAPPRLVSVTPTSNWR